MEDRINRKPSVEVVIFGCIFIILGLWGLYCFFYYYYGKFTNNILPLLLTLMSFSKELKDPPISLAYCVITTYFGLLYVILLNFLYLISGIGVLRLRYWARYIIIFLFPTSVISKLGEGLLLGWAHLNIPEILILIGISSLVIWFFMRDKIKKQFEIEGVRFRLRSMYGVAICVIVFWSAIVFPLTLGFKIYCLLKYDAPFFITRPKIMTLQEKVGDKEHLDKYRRVELFNASFLIPRGFIIVGLHKPPDPKYSWTCILGDSKTFISLDNKTLYDIGKGLANLMGFKNTYHFEKAMYNTNWIIPLLYIRTFSSPAFRNGVEIIRIESPKINGFMKLLYDENNKKRICECSFYSKENKSSKGMMVIYYEKDFSKDELMNIVSSFAFLKEDEIEAHRYFEEGLHLLDSNDSIGAQFKLANAYYLSSANPEYGYTLAKTLINNGDRGLHPAKRILKDILKSRPEYKEAKELLETIELIKQKQAETKDVSEGKIQIPELRR